MKRYLSLVKFFIFAVFSGLFCLAAFDLIVDPDFYYFSLFVIYFNIFILSSFIFWNDFYSIRRDRRSEKEDK